MFENGLRQDVKEIGLEFIGVRGWGWVEGFYVYVVWVLSREYLGYFISLFGRGVEEKGESGI